MYKFFIFAIIVLVLGGVGAGATLYYSNAGEGLRIMAAKPEIITIGVPFTLGIAVINDSRRVFNDANIEVVLPEGVAFLGSNAQKTTERKNIGNVGAGSAIKQEFSVVVLNGENSVKSIAITVNYIPEGVSSRFEKTNHFDLVVGAAGLAVDVSAPEHAVSGNDFTVTVSYKNVTASDFTGLRLKMEYPPEFAFQSADLMPDVGNNLWDLGGLHSGSEMHFNIKGNLIGKEESAYEFKAKLEAAFAESSYQIAEKSINIDIVPSPLNVSIGLPPEIAGVATPDEELAYEIAYTNTTDQGFRDAMIWADLKGEMFDLGSLRTKGVVGPLGNSVLWNRVTNPELAVVAPHASGVINFTIKTKKTYPVRRLSDRNFTLKVDARIESPTVPKTMQATKTVGVGRSETKVRGTITVDAKVLFRDANAGIVNRGSFPPKVGVPTNYTVHWVITNPSTDISDANVTATLAGGVNFTGITKLDSGGTIDYAANTQTVTWHVDKIPAGAGVIRPAFEAVFQIEAAPNPTMVRSYMPLIGETIVQGKDEFTGIELQGKDAALGTALPDDSTVGGSQGIVVQ